METKCSPMKSGSEGYFLTQSFPGFRSNPIAHEKKSCRNQAWRIEENGDGNIGIAGICFAKDCKEQFLFGDKSKREESGYEQIMASSAF